ncbi:MAG TPA: hypothetical protein VF784_07610, partial [Anaerolineales bacterium]
MKRRILFLIVLLALFAAPSSARADVAPPEQAPGSNPEPTTGTTQVRMQAETVLIEVQSGDPPKSLGSAHVTADFTMHNTGDAPESMAARFPIATDSGWGSVNFISDVRIRVAGKPVATREITGKDPAHEWSTKEVPWAQFDVTFPAQQDLSIEVQYTVQATGESPFSWFTYILSTGAGWKDTIGSIDIVVQLPYEANIENVLPAVLTPNGRFDGNAIRWHYNDLEPTTRDNFIIRLVAPPLWQQLLAEQNNVALHPTDGESWGRIGMLSKKMAFSSRRRGFRIGDHLDPGAEQLYQLALQAYDKAVTLLPKDALWHAGYADLLGYYAWWEGQNGTNTDAEAAHSISEIQIAKQLAPNDPQVQDIAMEISLLFPDGQTPYQLQAGRTATSTLNAPTVGPTQEAPSQATASPSPTVAPSPDPM